MEIFLGLQFDWLQNKIIYNSPETLYHLTAVKTAVKFWNEEEIVEEIKGEVTTRNIQKKILSLPEPLKNKVAQKAELIEEQLLKFVELLPHNFLKQNRWTILKDQICWTSQGTVNKIKTAEALVDATELDMETRFQIAVLFYLKDRINTLSDQMPADYINKNRSWFYKIVSGDANLLANQHLDIVEALFCFNNFFALKPYNELCCYYYWILLNEHEEYEFMKQESLYDIIYHFSYRDYLMFRFIHCDRESRMELIQNENNLYILLEQFLGLRWLHFFNIFAKDVLKLLSAESLGQLLDYCMEKSKATIAFKKEYLQICTTILHSLTEKNLITELYYDSTTLIIHTLCHLMEEGEIKKVKDFLQSISGYWIKDYFSIFTDNLVHFITASYKCGLLESVIRFAFPTVMYKEEFLGTVTMQQITTSLILEWNQMEDVDNVLSLFLDDSEDLKHYKVKFAEEKGCNVCCAFLYRGQ